MPVHNPIRPKSWSKNGEFTRLKPLMRQITPANKFRTSHQTWEIERQEMEEKSSEGLLKPLLVLSLEAGTEWPLLRGNP